MLYHDDGTPKSTGNAFDILWRKGPTKEEIEAEKRRLNLERIRARKHAKKGKTEKGIAKAKVLRVNKTSDTGAYSKAKPSK